MNKNKIKELALATGFKLKPQPDGSEDLNPYVYEFAKLLLDEKRKIGLAELLDKTETAVIADIKAERVRQLKDYAPENDDNYTERQFINLVDSYLTAARHADHWAWEMQDPKNIQYRRFMIKTAALCIAAIESFDRKHLNTRATGEKE